MTLLWLLLVFSELSVLAFGGGYAVLPEMRHLVVGQFHWTTSPEFSAMFGLAQAAPGPNLMIVPLIGWHTAAVAGVVAVIVGKFLPSSVIAYQVSLRWERWAGRPWLDRVSSGLVPVSTGLIAASAAVIIGSTDHGVALALVTAGVTILAFARRIHPVLLLVLAAVVGIALAATGTIP